MADTGPSQPGPEADGPSALDIASLAGTWAAATLAILALVGIVGPLLAIRAAQSNRNRALNAVRDKEHKYITTGLRVGRHATLFRRVLVPDLAPTYDTNHANVPNIIKAASNDKRFRFRFPKFTKWNTGWAMLAAAAEAYSMYENQPLAENQPLVGGRGGAWDVINSTSAIVVSKYWILLFGLLGRYSSFASQRLTLAAERRTAHPRAAQAQYGAALYYDDDSDDDDRSETSVPVSYKSVESGRRNTEDSPSSFPSRYRLSQGKHGGWELISSNLPEISGFTGRFRSLGRQTGKWTAQTALAFDGGYAMDVMGEGEALPQDMVIETEPLLVHFWLANGFIPHGFTGAKHNVLSVLDPINNRLTNFLTPSGSNRRFPAEKYCELQPVACLSSDIMNSATALNQANHIAKIWRLVRIQDPTSEDEDDWYTLPNPHSEVRLRRKNLFEVVHGLLLLKWHDLGYLRWKSECKYWNSIMKKSAVLLDQAQVKIFADGAIRCVDIFDWSPAMGYHPMKVKELVQFEQMVHSLISETLRPAKAALAALFITDLKFAHAVYTLFDPATETDQAVVAPAAPAPDGQNTSSVPAQTIPEPLGVLQPETQEGNGSDYVASERTRSQSSVGAYESNAFPEDQDQGQNRNPTHEPWDNQGQEEQRRRLEARENKCGNRGICRNFRLSKTGSDVTIKWDTQVAEIGFENGWAKLTLQPQVGEVVKLGQQFDEVAQTTPALSLTTADPEKALDENDLKLISIWAAARCSLWLNSDDSLPLIKFIRNLDRHVFVM